jgi:hypothetical protein
MTATALVSGSPLAATLARVAALDPYLKAQTITRLHGDWFAATELIDDSQRLHESLHRIMRPYSLEDREIAAKNRHIAASFLINSYAWALPAAAIGAYLSERRVPDLDPSNVALRFSEAAEEEEGGLEIAFLSDRMAVLPDDPAAGQPDVIVVDESSQLREWMRLRLERHLQPIIEAIYGRTRFGRRAQWNLVADDCAALFLWVGQRIRDQQRSCAEGLAFVGAPDSPMRQSRTGYFTLEYAGHCETFRKRGGCCLYYKLSAGQNCSTCSLIAEEERDGRLLKWMATMQQQETAS